MFFRSYRYLHSHSYVIRYASYVEHKRFHIAEGKWESIKGFKRLSTPQPNRNTADGDGWAVLRFEMSSAGDATFLVRQSATVLGSFKSRIPIQIGLFFACVSDYVTNNLKGNRNFSTMNKKQKKTSKLIRHEWLWWCLKYWWRNWLLIFASNFCGKLMWSAIYVKWFMRISHQILICYFLATKQTESEFQWYCYWFVKLATNRSPNVLRLHTCGMLLCFPPTRQLIPFMFKQTDFRPRVKQTGTGKLHSDTCIELWSCTSFLALLFLTQKQKEP